MYVLRGMRGRLLGVIAVFVLLAHVTAEGQRPALEGFGATTAGGNGGAVVAVTSLADSGPGSLRAALAAGGRTIVFTVAGDIVLADHLYVRGANITIDGFSAPPPGITLRNRGLIIRGNRGVHDIIVQNIRVRDASIDGIQVAYGAYNVVLDHVSVSGSGDGNIDITEDSHDVTVSWSILGRPAPPEKNMLIKYRASRVTLHHNVLVAAAQRNPQASIDDDGTVAADTTVDMRNNIVWDWRNGSGTMVRNRALANIVGNVYASPSSSPAARARAVMVCGAVCGGVDGWPGHAWISGNVGLGGIVIPPSTEAGPFAAPPLTTQDACTAAVAVAVDAGARPRDVTDAAFVAQVQLAGCAGAPSSSLPGSSAQALSGPS